MLMIYAVGMAVVPKYAIVSNNSEDFFGAYKMNVYTGKVTVMLCVAPIDKVPFDKLCAYIDHLGGMAFRVLSNFCHLSDEERVKILKEMVMRR